MVAPIACSASEPERIRSLSMSPVEIWGIPRQWFNIFACVPFPEPGEPNSTMAFTKSDLSDAHEYGPIAA